MIARAYLRGWFALDALAVFPFELVITSASGGGGGGLAGGGAAGGVDTKNLRLIAFCKAPRLLRLSKVLRTLDRMGNATLIKILRLFLLFCFITHLGACGLNLLEVSQDPSEAGATWFKAQVVRVSTRRPPAALPPARSLTPSPTGARDHGLPACQAISH